MKLNLSSFLQWRINIFLCQILGWRITFHYIALLGKLYFFFNWKEKYNIKKAVKAVFSDRKEENEIRAIIQNVFQGIFAHYYEKFFNTFSAPETLKTFVKTHVECEGIATIQNGLAKGKGVLLITGHFGGVELIPAFLTTNNYPVTVIVRFSSDSLRQVALKQAHRFSVKIIDADRTPNVMKAVFKDLGENRIVLIQCDEIDAWKPSKNDRISFLGKPVLLDRSINILTKRYGASIVFGAMHRNYQYRYKFIATSWEEMSNRLQRSNDMSLGAVVLKFMEQYIYKFPEEWYQWKKYPALDTFLPVDMAVETPVSIPMLEPAPE